MAKSAWLLAWVGFANIDLMLLFQLLVLPV